MSKKYYSYSNYLLNYELPKVHLIILLAWTCCVRCYLKETVIHVDSYVRLEIGIIAFSGQKFFLSVHEGLTLALNVWVHYIRYFVLHCWILHKQRWRLQQPEYTWTAMTYCCGILIWTKGWGELYPDKGKEQSLLVAIQSLLFQMEI